MSKVFDIFVIMPFDKEFQDMYDHMKEILEGEIENVRVYRADDLLNQQNILKDIVKSIFSADLVIADLTSLNPNVFYELGLAHSFNKDVILLTQDVDELPFDLRSYRVLPYSMHFKEFTEKMNSLKRIVDETIGGTCLYSNPVSDFVEIDSIASPRNGSYEINQQSTEIKPQLEDVNENQDIGYLDAITEIETSLNTITLIVNEFSDQTVEIGGKANEATAEINKVTKSNASGNAAFVRKQARKLGEFFRSYSDSVERTNEEYEKEWNVLDSYFVSLIRSMKMLNNIEDKSKFYEFLDSLDDVKNQLISSIGSLKEMSETAESLKGLERTLNRSVADTVLGLDHFLDLLRMSESSLERVVTFGRALTF